MRRPLSRTTSTRSAVGRWRWVACTDPGTGRWVNKYQVVSSGRFSGSVETTTRRWVSGQGPAAASSAHQETWWADYPGITNPDSEVPIPLAYRHSSWEYYSDLFVRNSGVTATNINIELFDPEQRLPHPLPTISNVQPNQTAFVPLSYYGSILGPSFPGSARITNSANQQLAVSSTNYKLDHSTMAESAHTGDMTNIVYALLVQNYNYGYI